MLTAPFGFPYLVLNTKQGLLANVALRQAVQTALNEDEMLGAGFGDPKFFSAEANHFAEEHAVLFDRRHREATARAMRKQAAALVAAAKYDGTPIRILTSQQYDFHYRMALVMAEKLKAAGFKVDMQVVDWATLIQRRNDPALWDIYITHSGRAARADADAAAARRRRARLVELAGQGGRARGVQRRSRPGQARRAVGQGAAGRLHRGALHPRRQFQQRDGALGEARRLRRDAVAVLLEHGTAEVEAVHGSARVPLRRRRRPERR